MRIWNVVAFAVCLAGGGASAAPRAVFDNLASRDPKGVYMAGTGYSLGGPGSPIGLTLLAAAFTPANTATLASVQVAAGYISGAENTVLVTIYADAAGAPGMALWQGAAVLPTFGTCCATVTAGAYAPVRLIAGTQYWLGLGPTASGTDSFAGWSFNVADQVDAGNVAANLGAGWLVSSALPNLAFAVWGK